LNQHIEEKKFPNKLNKALLAKMVKIGVECPGFTNTQKRAIIKKYVNIFFRLKKKVSIRNIIIIIIIII